nr:S8 family serine peptidase [candidate division Zixibacteria bacterium]
MLKSRLVMFFGFLITCVFILGVIPGNAVYYEGKGQSKPVLMPGRLQVQFESDVNINKLATSFDRVSFGISTLDQALEKIGAREANQIFPWRQGADAIVGDNDMSKFFEVIFSEDLDINQVMEELLQNPYVRSVDPVYALPLAGIQPDDPEFYRQWGIKKINDTTAWLYEKGSDTAKIAIVDSGVRFKHPDLESHIWVNPGEDNDNDLVVYDDSPADSNGVDDDLNGRVDDLIGYDFFSGFSGLTCWEGEDCNTPDNNPDDFNGHGTHCAGIAAAITNNAYGVAGVAGGWGGGLGAYTGPRIMCLRAGGSAVDPDFGYEAGYINTANAASAIDYAARMGADVINCSFGFPSYSDATFTAALQKADSAGAVVIHAAGNENSTTGDYYDTHTIGGKKLVVSVAWTNSDDRKNSSSNYGNWIDVCAPGTNIYSTYSDHYVSTLAYASGTSMSAPHVAGLVALIRSHDPEYPRDDIIDLIKDNCDSMPNEPLWVTGFLGFGRINAYNCLDSMATAAFSAGPTLIGEEGLTVDFTDESPYSPTSWLWDFGDGSPTSSLQNPSHTYDDYGFYTASLTVEDQFGTNTEVLKNLVMITADTIKFGSAFSSATIGNQFVIPVYMSNKFQAKNIYLPFRVRESNGNIPSYLTLDSISWVGLRTEYFEQIKKQYWDQTGKRFVVTLRSNLTGGSEYLAPDTGLILNLHFQITGSVPTNASIFIEDTTLSSYNLEIQSIINNYKPVMVPGHIEIAICDRGDANWDTMINILDVTFLINYLYKGGLPPVATYCGDANGSGNINILDATYLIAYLYTGGPPPPL